MSFTYTDFADFLESEGIPFRISGKSIAVKECPSCGGSKYKLLFNISAHEDGEPMFGRCMRGECGMIYSSFNYLQAMEVDLSKIHSLHGNSVEENLRSMQVMDAPDFNTNTVDKFNEAPIIDISNLVPITAMPDHFVAKYARGRGYTDLFSDKIMMDMRNNSVVFIIHNGDNKPVGYQERFVSKNAFPKCKTSYGFTRDFVLAFPNSGDLVVCEGPFTALSAWHYGYYALCTFGCNFTNNQFDAIMEIARSKSKKILFAKDMDDAGIKTAKMFKTRLFMNGLDCKNLIPETGKDLNDSWKAGLGVRVENGESVNPALPELDFGF